MPTLFGRQWYRQKYETLRKQEVKTCEFGGTATMAFGGDVGGGGGRGGGGGMCVRVSEKERWVLGSNVRLAGSYIISSLMERRREKWFHHLHVSPANKRSKQHDNRDMTAAATRTAYHCIQCTPCAPRAGWGCWSSTCHRRAMSHVSIAATPCRRIRRRAAHTSRHNTASNAHLSRAHAGFGGSSTSHVRIGTVTRTPCHRIRRTAAHTSGRPRRRDRRAAARPG